MSGHHLQRHLTVSYALILYFYVLCTVYRTYVLVIVFYGFFIISLCVLGV